MNRIERMQEKNNAWLRRTGFTFGKLRAGGAPVPDKAWEHMRSKPYATSYSAKQMGTVKE